MLNKTSLKRVTFPSSELQMGVISYNVYNDSLATILSPNYFVGSSLRVGEIIMASGSDNENLLIVDTATYDPSGIATAITTKAIFSSPLNSFDAITSTVLSTSLASFTAAAAGTAVGITAAEYTAIQNIASAVIGGSSNATLTSANGAGMNGNFTEGNWTNYTSIPAGKKPFAFAMNVGAVGDFQMKVGTVAGLTNISNIIQSGAGLTYFAIKSPSFTTTDISTVAGFNLGGGFGSATSSGTYYYLSNNTLSIPNSSSVSERRYQVVAR